MSLNEFFIYWQGYQERLDVQMDMIAWHASISVSPWTKKGKSITPDKLRGKKSSAPTSGAEILSTLESNAEQKEHDSFWKEGKGKTWQDKY